MYTVSHSLLPPRLCNSTLIQLKYRHACFCLNVFTNFPQNSTNVFFLKPILYFLGFLFQNFSSVVGPNGSGKSNVIDAMLFVFGYKAKRLRQAKLSDLIHKSDGFQNLPFCRVTVFFQSVIDTDSGFDVVEDSQIKLSRVAFAPTGDRKTGDSQYRLNDKVSTYGEVTQVHTSQKSQVECFSDDLCCFPRRRPLTLLLTIPYL